MINAETIEELISYVLFTSYLKNDRPVSLIIIAKPESGKTAVLTKFAQNNGVVYVSDLTYTGLVDMLPRFETKELRTILIPDLLKLLGRKSIFTANLVTLMNAFIEEGITSIYTFKNNIRFTNPVRGNFIACLTSQDLLRHIGYWAKVGFISRVIPFSYGYSNETILKIFDYIIWEKYIEEKSIKLKLPKKEKEVTLPEELARQLQPISMKIASEAELFGFRIQKNLQSLAKACALYHNKNKVTKEHIEKIIRLTNWMNLKFQNL